MLTIRVGGVESFDDSSQKFVIDGGTVVRLEHSLVSVSKWESKYEKPFLSAEEKTPAELLFYIECMNVDPEFPPEVFQELSEANMLEINDYLGAKMTATWFAESTGAPRTREVITAELIYYWMTVFNISFECQHWHLNRLFTLIRVCNLKQAKPKKMGRAEAAQRNRELNAQRKKQLGTNG